MPTFSQLPSGRWRVQVRKSGHYRAATFATKTLAKDWALQIEAQLQHQVGGGFGPVPPKATLKDLIDKYREAQGGNEGRTKGSTLNMLVERLGAVKLSKLSAVTLREFIDKRMADGAGGVTIAGDLSFLSAVLKWGRHARRLDLNDALALEARKGLKYRKLRTRSTERDREPTDEELARLYALWQGNPRQRIDMPMVCRFALATGMRQDEICRLQVEDVDRAARTVVIRDRKDPQAKEGNHQTVPLLPAAWAIVEPLLTDRKEGQIFLGLRAASVSTAFTRACQALQPPIEDLHFHDLRHRATAEFFRMGLDIPRVALLTGHKTWAMLRRYTDIKPADVHLAVARHTAESENVAPLEQHRAARKAAKRADKVR
ncbi:tyrosine-type recombinase/integrase [Roseateles sp.]|uniref:tyrosine-type recombinase/integrase n=1 Tax=Roseateles sp. TaxID=1971397 RepID=UPI0039323EB3